MTIYLKQSTASQEVPLGFFLDTTDGNTEETGLTIANTDILLWKAGGTSVGAKNSGGATHRSNGIYTAVLDATDTDTLGPLVIYVHVAGALSVRQECMVLPANVYDSLVGGSDVLQADVTQIAGSAVDAAAAQLGVNVVNWKGSAAAAMTGDAYARLGAPAGASVSADVADLHTDIADVHTDVGTAITNIGDVHATDLPALKTVVDNIHDTDLPAVKTVVDDIHTDVGTAITAIGDVHATDLPALKTIVDDIHNTDLPAVKSDTAAILTDTAVIGALGAGLTAIPWNAAWDAEVQSEVADAIAAASLPTAAQVTDAVWDEVLHTDHEVASSASVLLQSAGGAADPWATALPGAYGAGTAGKIIGDNINAPIATVDTVVDAIKAKTDNLPASPANEATLTTIAGYLDTEVAAILADTNELQTDLVNGGRLDLLIDGIKAKTDLIPATPANEATLTDIHSDAAAIALIVDNIPTLAEIEASTVLAKQATLATILLRIHPNAKITAPVYSVTGKMTSCTVTRYPTKADADAGTNGVAYAVTATYDGDDNLATYNEVATA